MMDFRRRLVPVFYCCGHFARNSRSVSVNVSSGFQNKGRSTALQQAKKKQRDSLRMAAFMNKKDAENLPFHNVEENDFSQLCFNSLLRNYQPQFLKGYKKEIQTLESNINSQSACISFLRTENNDLKTGVKYQSDRCYNLQREVDRVTEKYKKLLDSQKRKTAETQQKLEKSKKSKEQQIEHFKRRYETLTEENGILFTKLQEKIDEMENIRACIRISRKHNAYIDRDMVEKLILDTQFISTLCVSERNRIKGFKSRGVDCRKCGSKKFHDRATCPASERKCGYCEKPGHFTIMCRDFRDECDIPTCI